MAKKLDKRILKNLKNDLTELNELYGKISEDPIEIDFASATVEDFINVTERLKEARRLVKDLEEGYAGIAEGIRNTAREWSPNFKDPLKEGTNSMKKILGLAEQLQFEEEGIHELNLKQLKDIEAQAKAEKSRLKLIAIELTKKAKEVKLSKDELSLLNNINGKVRIQDELLDKAKERLAKEKDLQKTLGITGQIFKGLAGTFGKLGIGTEYFEEMNSNMRKAADSGSKLKVFGAGIKGIFKGLGKALTDPVVIFGLIVKSIKFLMSAMKMIQKETFEVAKGFGVAGAQAEVMYQQFNEIGDQGGSIYYFTDEMISNQIKLNEAAGLNLNINKANAKEFQDLTKYMGYSEDVAQNLFMVSVEMGVPFSQQYDMMAAIVSETDKQTGVYVRMQDITEDIAGLSAKTKLSFHGNFESMVQAAHAARRMGMSLEEVANQGGDLLDFTTMFQKQAALQTVTGLDLTKEIRDLQEAEFAMDPEKKAKALEAFVMKTKGAALKNKVALKTVADVAFGGDTDAYLKAVQAQENVGKLKDDQLEAEKASGDELAQMGKEAQSFDRAMESAIRGMKKGLQPIVMFLEPYIVGLAESVGYLGQFLNGPIGKILVAMGGFVAGGYIAMKGFEGLKSLFLGKRGSNPMNPEYVINLNESGGPGGMPGGPNKMRHIKIKGNVFKHLSKSKGLTRTIQRATIKTFGKNKVGKVLYNSIGKVGKTKVMSTIGKPISQVLARTMRHSGHNLMRKFGTTNVSKIAQMAKTGRYAKGTVQQGLKVGGRFMTFKQQRAAQKVASKYISKSDQAALAFQKGLKQRTIKPVTKVQKAKQAVKDLAANTVSKVKNTKAAQKIANAKSVKTAKNLVKTTSKATSKTIAKAIPGLNVAVDLGFAIYDGATPQQDQYDPVTGEKIYDDQVNDLIPDDALGGTLKAAYSLTTGSDYKGSMLTDVFGGERGSFGDEMLGLGTAAGSGAATGASIGALLTAWSGPGAAVGASIGAAIGAVVGTVAEGVKILTDPNSATRKAIDEGIDIISEWSSIVWNGITDWTKYAWGKVTEFVAKAWKYIKEWVSKAWGKLTKGIKDGADYVGEKISDFGNWAYDNTLGRIFANGGLVGAANGMMGESFSKPGGIVSKPMNLPSGGTPTAVVPLPNGKSIPVTVYSKDQDLDRQIIETMEFIKTKFAEGRNVYLNNIKVGESTSQLGA